MGVAEGMDKLSWLQSSHMGDHHEQQGIGRDVERHAQEQVGTALIQLQTQFTLSHIELEQRVARRQFHRGHLSDIPRADHDAAAVGRAFYLVDDLGYLVDGATIAVGPGAPLTAIDGTQVTVLVGPFIPDAHAVLLQPAHIGVATQEPQQFVDDGLEMHLLGCEQRETVGEVAAQLIAEHAARTGPCAVLLVHTIFHHMLD